MSSYFFDFESFVRLFGKLPPNCDPFSYEYTNWEMSFFNFLSGKNYCFELEGHDCCGHETLPPTVYLDIDTRISSMRTYADFLDIARPEPGMRILEMGCGQGNLLELLGRCGCNITGIEVSKSMVEYTLYRLASQNIKGRVACGTYYDVEMLDEKFDMVVFEASFHHCGEPVRLLELLYKHTTDNAKIFLLREPISPNFDRPWGIVRYDTETIVTIRLRGWLELGFRTDYFNALLQKTGFKLLNTHVLGDHTPIFEIVKSFDGN